MSKNIEDIVDDLLIATKKGKLKWYKPTHEDRYFVDIDDLSFQIWGWNDEKDGTDGHSIAMFHNEVAVDSISAGEYSPWYNIVGNLYNEARRSYYGVNSMIEKIQNILKS